MKQHKKGFFAGAALLLTIVLVISGCSGSKTDKADKNANEGAVNSATDEPAKLPRVAFVYIGPPGDGGWTFEHDKGRLYMEEKLGIKIGHGQNVPESADAERIITELAQNHDIIFTTSFRLYGLHA